MIMFGCDEEVEDPNYGVGGKKEWEGEWRSNKLAMVMLMQLYVDNVFN